jgi:hypothetical protein
MQICSCKSNHPVYLYFVKYSTHRNVLHKLTTLNEIYIMGYVLKFLDKHSFRTWPYSTGTLCIKKRYVRAYQNWVNPANLLWTYQCQIWSKSVQWTVTTCVLLIFLCEEFIKSQRWHFLLPPETLCFYNYRRSLNTTEHQGSSTISCNCSTSFSGQFECRVNSF